jgi:hypothetical protein
VSASSGGADDESDEHESETDGEGDGRGDESGAEMAPLRAIATSYCRRVYILVLRHSLSPSRNSKTDIFRLGTAVPLTLLCEVTIKPP